MQIVKYKNGRFAIADDDGKLVDTAQGYGYKTTANARNVCWYKFEGGQKKNLEQKEKYRIWVKSNALHGRAIELMEEECLSLAKDLFKGIITYKDIWDAVERELDITIPDYVRKHFLKTSGA